MSPSLPLADRYQRFRAAVFGGLEESPPLTGFAEPMTEIHLQSLWFAGEFGHDFTSTDGQRVQIRDFGEWNSGPGPDFRNCTVLVNGESHSGDIELDPDVRDWERHQHGANEDYNRVVLHLFVDQPANDRAYTRTAEHREVPQVRLNPAALTDGFVRPGPLAPARLGRCSTPLSHMGEAAVQSLLEASAQYRLQRKSHRLHLTIAAHGRDQAIYQALAQALGYRSNQRPFLLLAQRLPLRRIGSLDPVAREAMLFGVSGFLEATPFDEARDETRQYLRALWEQWWKQRSEFARWITRDYDIKWKLKSLRPGNHPQRRLGALAALLSQWGKISQPLKHADKWDRDAWCATVTGLRHDFWSLHYMLRGDPAARPVALIGETRVQEMLANVVYPLLVPDRSGLWSEYLELPALLDNQKVRRASLRLFGDSPLAATFQKKLHHQQGLLQVYDDFCMEDDSACADCPFPERLVQWQ
jgi:hypothetical protein